MSHKIGIIGGDGIGPEVINEGLKVIEAAGISLDLHNYDLGGSRYIKDGTILPDSILQEWRNLDALYLGAVGTLDTEHQGFSILEGLNQAISSRL